MITPFYSPALYDVAKSSLAVASVSPGGFPMANAFDKNDTTEWETSSAGTTSDYIGQDFTAAAPKKIRRVRLLQNASATFSVTSVSVQYSDDMSAWTTIAAGNSAVAAGDNTIIVADNGYHRGWRVKAAVATGGGVWSIFSLEFHINA